MSSNHDIVLKVENLSKVYRLGEVGTGTISHDLNRWFARIRGKEDPYSVVSSVNDRTQKAQKGEYVNALSDINFEVKKGEVLGIIGKNGAGKSTLLKVISQITAPTTGSIKAKGRIASLLEVGTGMHPEMTGKENVYLNGTILGMTKKEINAKFDEIMDFAGCAKYADTPVKRYSSGMKVRLGFAVAAFLEPEILIVDEVLAVGDAEFQKKAIGKMQDISSGDGRTVLFVSHNMATIQNLCKKSIVMKNGQISYLGLTKHAIDEYLLFNSKPDTLSDITNKNRKGSGEIKFTSFSTSTTKNFINQNNALITGEPCYFRLNYIAKCNLKNVIISIGFFSKSSKTFYTALRSDTINKYFDIDIGEGSVIFFISRLPFMQGNYSINILAKTKYGDIDWITDAFEIEVVNGDYYGTGVLPGGGREGLCVEFDVNPGV